MRYVCNFVFCLTLPLFAVAASGQGHETVARIGNQTLSLAYFETAAQTLRQTGYTHIEELDQAAKSELLDGIIARQLLIQEGIRRGFDRAPSIAGEVEKTRRRILLKELYERQAVQESYSFTEEQLRTFFAAKEYDTEVFSQHIVCSSEEEARQVLTALDEGAPFESLVGPHSIKPIQNRFGPGGWVGWFKIGELYDELKKPMTTMEIGSLYPDPVKTYVGYHVFRLKARRPVNFAANREWVQQQLLVQSRADDMAAYVKALRQQYQLVAHPASLAALLKLDSQAKDWERDPQILFTWRDGHLTARAYMAQVRQKRALHPAALDSATIHKEADNIAGRQIMMAEIIRLSLDQDPVIRREIDAKQAELVVKKLYQVETQKRAPTFSDEEIRAFYDEHIDQFTRADGKVTDFDFIHKSIRTTLAERANAQAMDDLLAELQEHYKDQIEIFPNVLAKAFQN
ncbi:MAG: hypothetical protein GKR89_14190 [Candidatus Latescibacteria bacterium]|nr:hypothetical protein [Candidatus Latescibacterota bacterium]